MHKLIRKLLNHLPLDFRVLYRQFLLRVIDLETLSIQADIPRFLGQFAGILILYSIFRAIGFFWTVEDLQIRHALLQIVKLIWITQQGLISTTMLVAGLIAVVSWDNIFPDRRDVMIVSPLPVRPRTILVAKVAAALAVLGIAIIALNFAYGLALVLVMDGIPHLLRASAAYWFTMISASLFLYCSVLTVQGFTALLLPRRIFLRVSAFLQLVAFGLFPAVYFLEPSIPTTAAMRAPEIQWVLASSPPYWFLGLFNQLNGSLDPNLAWLAKRAWIGLGIATLGAVAALLLCYLRTMKKIVEEPDLVPAARGWRWTPRFGSSVDTAIVLFSFRSFTRSRQHRLILAFFFSVVFGVALSMVRQAISAAALRPVSMELLVSTAAMISFAVFGFRSVFPLPISLNANWNLRITQLSPSQDYIAATRRALLLFAVLPTWLASAALALTFRPLHQVVVHLVVLALFGSILVDLCLIGFCKVPFTCSYLPGKANVQYLFWGLLVLYLPLSVESATFELSALDDPLQSFYMIALLGAVAAGLWAFNRHRAKSAVLYYEELLPEPITRLGLMQPLPPKAQSPQGPIVS